MANITDQELLAALDTASADARAVLGLLAQWPAAAGNVSVTLSNGVTFTLSGYQKIINDRASDQRAYAIDFGGAQQSTLTRDQAGRILTLTTVFTTSGLQLEESITRGSTGFVSAIQHVLRDASGAVLATINRTCNRDPAGRLVSIS